MLIFIKLFILHIYVDCFGLHVRDLEAHQLKKTSLIFQHNASEMLVWLHGSQTAIQGALCITMHNRDIHVQML